MSHKQTALARGHSMAIEASCPEHDLFGWATPAAEFDGKFEMTCEDTGELLEVNGWLFTVTRFPASS